MRITDLVSNASGGGSSGYEFEAGDVKVTTKNFEMGFFNLNDQAYLKRKTESTINQNLPGPCFDLIPFSDVAIVSDEIDNGYAWQLTNGDFICFTQRIPAYGDRLITISYYDSVTKTVTDSETYTYPDTQFYFDAVCNYSDTLYVYKNGYKSFNKQKYNKIQKITFDQVNKTVSTFTEITTLDRRITKVIYDLTNSIYLSYEHNYVITDTSAANSALYFDSNFENINISSFTQKKFNLDDFEFFAGASIIDACATEADIDEQVFNFNNRFYYSNFLETDIVYFYNKFTTNVDKIENVSQIPTAIENVNYVPDVILLLDSSGLKDNYSNILEITERSGNIIVKYEVTNSLIYYNAFAKLNSFDSSVKRIYLEKYVNSDYIIIDSAFDNVSFNNEMGILYSYFDSLDSTIKRDLVTFDGGLQVNVNSISVNTSQNLSNFSICPSHIFNNSDFYIIDNIGAVEYKDLKIKKVAWEDFSFPYVYVAQVTTAPTGLNYLLKV